MELYTIYGGYCSYHAEHDPLVSLQIRVFPGAFFAREGREGIKLCFVLFVVAFNGLISFDVSRLILNRNSSIHMYTI